MRRTVSGAAEPRMSAGGERKLAAAVFAGAIIVARASAVAYRMHTYNLSSRPRFALGPFSFENCCYARSCRCRFRLLERAPQPISDFSVQRPEGALGRGLKQAPQIFLEPHIQFWRSTGFVH
jgi:hypothetical protein